MLNEPLEQPRLELLLDAVVESGLPLVILIVDVRALHRKEFRRLESLPEPAGKKRRHLDDNVDASARTTPDF